MGWYQRLIVPRLIDLAMRNRSLDAYRQRTIGAASGLVLEVGVGSGQNLPRYGPPVDRVYAVDPSLELLRSARNKIAGAALPASLIGASAEQLPFANTIFDTVVTSWTLCSIPDPARALVEMRRVLKPGGKPVFVEHGLSPLSALLMRTRSEDQAWSVSSITPLDIAGFDQRPHLRSRNAARRALADQHQRSA